MRCAVERVRNRNALGVEVRTAIDLRVAIQLRIQRDRGSRAEEL